MGKYRRAGTNGAGGDNHGGGTADKDLSVPLAKKAVRSLLDLMELHGYDQQMAGVYLAEAAQLEGVDVWDWWGIIHDFAKSFSGVRPSQPTESGGAER